MSDGVGHMLVTVRICTLLHLCVTWVLTFLHTNLCAKLHCYADFLFVIGIIFKQTCSLWGRDFGKYLIPVFA